MTVFRHNEGRLTVGASRLTVSELGTLRLDHGLPDLSGVQCEITRLRALWIADGVQTEAPAAVVAAAISLLADESLADDLADLRTPELAPEPTSWEVLRLTVLDRLQAAGLWGAAKSAMQGGDGLAWDRWQAAVALASDDAQVVGLLEAIGADPAEMLAREV